MIAQFERENPLDEKEMRRKKQREGTVYDRLKEKLGIDDEKTKKQWADWERKEERIKNKAKHRPHKCNMCDRRYTTKGSLTTHKVNKHAGTLKAWQDSATLYAKKPTSHSDLLFQGSRKKSCSRRTKAECVDDCIWIKGKGCKKKPVS